MGRRSALHHFPQYFLYGEASQDVEERFLHVESIAARSRLHDWTIRPHAHRDLNHVLLILRGGGVFKAEDVEHRFAAPALLTVPLACVHGFDFRPGTDGWIVTVSGALTRRMAREHSHLSRVFEEASALPLSRHASAALRPQFECVVAEFRSNLPAWKTAAEAAFTAILVHAVRHKLELAPEGAHARSAESLLAGRFRELVEKHYRTQMSIAEYARRLAVSPERLRLACLHSTASSPLALLNARRLLEAKRSLLYTNMSVALIGETCGFLDPAYFSRFFSRSTGESPRAYRRKRDPSITRE